MGQEFQVPAVFSNKQMSPAFQTALAGQDDSLAEGIGQSYAVVGYKGKQWSLRYRGQRHNFIDAQGFGIPYLDVIVLNQAKTKSKSFYKKYEPGSSDGERPVCASMDGIVPDPDVVEKQCDSCALCPRNIWRTDPQTGRKGRECTDYKRLAVMILPTHTKPLLGEPLMEPAFLRVPPASLNSLAIMGETMDRQGFHYSSYITRITFDPNKSWPEMVFRPLQQLTDGEAPVILKLRQDPLSARIIGGDVALPHNGNGHAALSSGVDTGLVALSGPTVNGNVGPTSSVTTIIPSQATATVLPATPTTAPSEPRTAAPVDSGLSSPPASSSQPTLVETGFGAAPSAAPPQPSSPSPGTVPTASALAADAGQAEESDAELDARIAALITK
jgi:hypothetical protein